MVGSAEPRHLIRLPVELTGEDECGNRFRQTAFTQNVSQRGARITQAPSFLSPLTVVELKYRGRRSLFRVVWVGAVTNEVGLLTLDTEKCIWGHPLPGSRIHSVPPKNVPVSPRAASLVVESPSPSTHIDLVEGVGEQRSTNLGYFCKDDGCRGKREFHRLPDDLIIWDIWPQKFECPVTGRRYEYSKRDVIPAS